MSPHVPPELIDQIIDHLHDDPKSLNACALAARNWLPSSRYHRFRSIRFRSAKGIDSFHQFSQDAPGMLPYYQEAAICDNSEHLPTSILEAAAKACLNLPNLERIKFNNRICASTPRLATILSPIADKITTLNLSGTLLASCNDFWPLISSFPNLNIVQACGVNFGSMEEPAFPLVNTYEPPITTFSLSGSRNGFVIDHLTNPPFPLRFLKKFEFFLTDPNQPSLVPLAESIRATVEHLRFGTALIHRADDPRIPDFVSSLNNLDTLVIDKIYALRPGDGPVESLLWVPLVLESVTAPIRKLCIELMVKNINHLDSVDWHQIDHILTHHEPFLWLNEVGVNVIPTSAIRGTVDTEALGTSVGQRLPMTSRRGILRCTAKRY